MVLGVPLGCCDDVASRYNTTAIHRFANLIKELESTAKTNLTFRLASSVSLASCLSRVSVTFRNPAGSFSVSWLRGLITLDGLPATRLALIPESIVHTITGYSADHLGLADYPST